jgi:uncharacterized lipoprotein YbaY
MRIVMLSVLAACALAATGCEEKKADAPKPTTSAAAAAPGKPAPAPAKSAAPGGW